MKKQYNKPSVTVYAYQLQHTLLTVSCGLDDVHEANEELDILSNEDHFNGLWEELK